MKIGIEAERANVANPTGVERYARELIFHLAKLDQHNQYVLYFRTEPRTEFKKLPANFQLKVLPFPMVWTQTRLTLELLLHPVDVFFMAIQALPFFHPRNSVITVHDIAYEFFPKAFGGFMLFYLKLTTRWGVWRAKRIVTVSDVTKHDIVRVYGANEKKITTVHLGLNPELHPEDYSKVQGVLDKYGLSYKKYILFVSTLQPRKNIPKLIDAYLKLKKEHHIEEKLVIAGGRGWLWEPIMKKIDEAKGSGVMYLEYVPQSDLTSLYSGAVMLTQPSIYEGFGFPPLEAMACGTPVVVSNISSLPEVVGDAGVLVDPNSVNSIAEGMLRLLVNKELRDKLSEQGIARAAEFTWDKTASEVLKIIEESK